MSEAKKTCCPAYAEALKHYTGGDPEKVKLFATGFVFGQAEKVDIGACAAAMFRPAPEYQAFMHESVLDACRRYGLNKVNGPDGEMWIARDLGTLNRMLGVEKNSAEWHFLRALACGVRQEDIDLKFHERQGYGQPVDSIDPAKWENTDAR